MDLDSVPAYFASTQIGFEHTKAEYCRGRLCKAHKTTLAGENTKFSTRTTPQT